MNPFDEINTGDEGDLDQLKDELLSRLQDEDFSAKERGQIERQLTSIAVREYEVSKSEFDNFLTSDSVMTDSPSASDPLTGATSDPAALLEQALLNHDVGMDEGGFGMDLPEDDGSKPPFGLGVLDNDGKVPKLSKQDSFDTFASAFTNSLDELSIETDPFCGEDPFTSCVLEPKKAKRRKTSHERKSRASKSKKVKDVKVKKEPKTKEAKAPKPRGTHRRTKSAETAARAPKIITPKRAATPPPAGRIDHAENGRVIVRRGPRGKYTCGRCGARKEGHVCDIRVARSVESQVDLAITKHGAFQFDSPLIRILTPRAWVSTPESIAKQVSELPRAISAA